MLNLEGQILKGRYRVEALIGRGGMAEVYRAWDTWRNYHVAIKVMREDLAEDMEFVRRFRREAQALAALAHENIVRFYGFERDDLIAFIVMRYVEGAPLRSTIARADGPLPMEQVISVTKQVCAALHYAHLEGVIHRDVKPGNVMIQPDGRALVADFGIAKAADAATATTVMPGTPAYMSPEQCRSEPLDVRTDVYGLGVVVYEMLAGRRPFVGETAEVATGSTRERIRWEQMHATPPPLQRFNPAVSPEVEAVVLKALAKDREARWPTVQAFWRAFVRAMGQEAAAPIERPPVAPQPPPTPPIPPLGPVTPPVVIPTPGPPRTGPVGISRGVWVAGAITLAGLVIAFLALGTRWTARPTPTALPSVARITNNPVRQPAATSTRPPTRTPLPTATPVPPTRAVAAEMPTSTPAPPPTVRPTGTPTTAPTSTPSRTPKPPTATRLPTRTTAPTSTPSRTPKPPTATRLPTRTPVPTRPPTHTPAPTATPVVAYAPPSLLEPVDGASLSGISAFRWSWSGTLGPDEYFDVRIWKVGEPHYGVSWTRETKYDYDPRSKGGGDFEWSVAVIRGQDGKWLEDKSAEATPRRFSSNVGGGGGGGGDGGGGGGGGKPTPAPP